MNRRSFPLTAGSLGLLSPRIGGLRHLLEDPPQRHTGGPVGNLCRSPLVRSGSAVTPIAQTALPAAQIPKYVDPLSTFFGARTSAATINVSLQEVQQAVLPAAIYASLPAPFRQGTFVWGYHVGDNPPIIPVSRLRPGAARRRR